jgi:tetratricopeptide (TPR) repeat protein
MAQIDAEEGDSDLALSKIKKVLQSDPNSAEAWAAEASVFEAKGRGKDAIEAINRAKDIDPDNSMWWLALGRYYKSAGDIESAGKTWKTATEKDPENFFAWYDLGIANKQLDKLSDAREDFLTALKLAPDDEYSLRALGTVYQLEGNYAEAEKMDKQAINLDANDYQAWANLGNVYAWSGGKRSQAVEAYNRAISIAEARFKDSPKSVNLSIDLANFYASIGDAEKSLPLIRKALALAPDDPGVQYLAGYSYELLGQREKAIPLMAQSVVQGGPANEMRQSPELASLRNDPAFRTAMEQATAKAAVDKKSKLN